MPARARIYITAAIIAFGIWFVPWVFLLKLGVVRYAAYEADGSGRFWRVSGPLAHYLSPDAEWTPDQAINLSCRAALVAAEDVRFYSHFGVDLRSLWLAARRGTVENETGWGGSSISQQLVKNIFLVRDKTLLRKLR